MDIDVANTTSCAAAADFKIFLLSAPDVDLEIERSAARADFVDLGR